MEQSHIDLDVAGAKGKSLFVKSVNALMAQQELLHQQVMSYLVGGGDHYKSHAFISISWDHLSETVRRMEEGNDSHHNAEVSMSVDGESIQSNDLVCDYQLRPSKAPFVNMTFWQYAQNIEKISVMSKTVRMDQNNLVAEQSNAGMNSVSQPANPHGKFMSEHPQYATHMLQLHVQKYIVSFVGCRVPH